MIEVVNINGHDVLKISNAILGPWRSNFKGEKNKFGDSRRCFYMMLTDEEAAYLSSEFGITIKETNPPADSGYSPEKYVKVMVKYHDEPEAKRYDPKLYLIQDGKPVELDLETIELLDGTRFDRVDLTLTIYESEVSGKTWYTLYCREGFFQPSVTSAWANEYGPMMDIPGADEEKPF